MTQIVGGTPPVPGVFRQDAEIVLPIRDNAPEGGGLFSQSERWSSETGTDGRFGWESTDEGESADDVVGGIGEVGDCRPSLVSLKMTQRVGSLPPVRESLPQDAETGTDSHFGGEVGRYGRRDRGCRGLP
ncbi:MAG: hypothetical protein OXF02_01725 [Simkaniaceae bacterium]|nr:hypothetical protein [Simkaniaceae bacterium]